MELIIPASFLVRGDNVPLRCNNHTQGAQGYKADAFLFSIVTIKSYFVAARRRLWLTRSSIMCTRLISHCMYT